MTPDQERASPIEKPVPRPAEEARQDIIVLMQEAKPYSPQARAIADLLSWYGVELRRKNEGLDHGVGHFRPLSITRQRHWLAYHFMAMRHEGLCQVF